MNLTKQYQSSLGEGIVSRRRAGAALSIRERLRKRRCRRLLQTLAIRLGVFFGAAWTIVFAVGFLFR